jgi:pSer/pThr/pTyr-binding forkhead associated (FHA) protein
MQKCHQCGQAVSAKGVFCQFCGAKLKKAAVASLSREAGCPSCAAVLPPGTNYCPSCGRKLIGTETRVPAPQAEPQPPRLVVVRRDGSDGPTYPITRAQFDIGRTEGDLMFEDPHMAARHARIIERAGAHIIVPLENRNGVYLRIREPVDLTDGDHVLIGKEVLRFDLLPDVERTVRPALEHGVVLFGTPLRSPWGRLRQMTTAGTCRDVYHLNRSEIVLGREQGDVVFAEDEFLSRRHAQLEFHAGRVVLSDLGSSNGTFVRLRAQHVFTPGEMIRIGDELLRFEIG